MKSILKNSIKIFFKGILMGAADIVPGISGGTIALVTEIYERFILSIYGIFSLLILFLKAPFSRNNRKFFIEDFKSKISEIKFLTILVFGIALSFLVLSRFILNALHFFPAYIYSFFFGLIFASAGIIFKSQKNKKNIFLFGSAGFILAFIITGFENLGASHSLPIIMVSGFIASCAMLLPGISGSFMLLMMGQYKFMLSALSNFELVIIIVFLSGFGFGAFVMSKLISHFLKKYESQTIIFLVGLMFGGLRLPIGRILSVSLGFWNPLTILLSLVSAIAGFVVVLLIDKMK